MTLTYDASLKQEQKETSKQNSTRKIRDRWAAGVEDLRVYIEFAMHHARRHENVKVNICDTIHGVNVRSLLSMNNTKLMMYNFTGGRVSGCGA